MVLQRVLERDAQVLLLVDPAELLGDRRGISSATTCMPAARLWPARRARATSSSASGSCAANFFSRLRRLFHSQSERHENITKPASGAKNHGTLGQPAQPSRRTTASTHADAEQRARLDVAVGLLEQLLEARGTWASASPAATSCRSRRPTCLRMSAELVVLAASCRSACRGRSLALRPGRRAKTKASRPTRPATATKATMEIHQGDSCSVSL